MVGGGRGLREHRSVGAGVDGGGGGLGQSVADGRGAGWTFLGRLGQQLEHEDPEFPGHGRVVPPRRHGRRVDLLGDDGHGVGADERRAAGEELVEEGTERVQIGAGLDLLAQGLLGGHVRHRAHHHPLLGEAGAAGGDGGRGQAEVTETGRASLGEPDVGRLDIAVHDASFVGVFQRLGDLVGDAHGLGHRKPMVLGAFEQVVDRSAGHVLAHDVGPAVFVADVEHGDDVGVVAEAAHGLSFPAYPLEAGGVEILGLHGGQGHLPVEGVVVCEVDALTPPFTEKSLDWYRPRRRRMA